MFEIPGTTGERLGTTAPASGIGLEVVVESTKGWPPVVRSLLARLCLPLADT